MGSNATQPRKRLGAWSVRSNDTVYQADRDGEVCALTTLTTVVMLGFTDGATPPTVERQKAGTAEADEAINFPVKKGDYWKVFLATTVFWIPWEP